MRHFQLIRAAAIASAGVAALSLGACNQNTSSQNGAYVAASSASSAPVSSQPLPPSNSYQAIADSPPPPLPVYDQPPIPSPGYVWTPGYWDWSDADADYYWVPGTWIEPPDPGLVWTPGYWRFYDGRYLFSDGYWGPEVGFYGGVDYGYGYGGTGYDGGRWQGNQFYYNSQVNNLGGRQINTVYSQVVSSSASRVSFNGGPGGLHVAPVQAEVAAAQANHTPPTHVQVAAVRAAQAQPQFRASVNGGAPPIAATSRPSAFNATAGVTATRSAAGYTPPVRQSAAPAGLPGGTTRPTEGPAASRLGGTPGPAPAVIAARSSGFAGHAQVERPAAFGAPAAVVRAPAPVVSAPSPIHAQATMRVAPPFQAPPTRAAPLAVVHAAAPRPAAPPPPAVRLARPAQSSAPGRP
jgi:hypothetical protein